MNSPVYVTTKTGRKLTLPKLLHCRLSDPHKGHRWSFMEEKVRCNGDTRDYWKSHSKENIDRKRDATRASKSQRETMLPWIDRSRR